MTRVAWLGHAICALALVLAWEGSAVAEDSFSATRTDTLAERSHSAVLSLQRDHAELVAQRAIWNAGAISDQATFYIDLPDGAVATRLRSRGIGPSAPWFEGELLEAEAAAARYQHLTGIGGYFPKDPALLSWRRRGLLALQVFPCPPHSQKLVEYTLSLPYVYAAGARHLSLRRLGTAELAAQVRVQVAEPEVELRVDGKRVASGSLLPVPGENPLDLSLHAPGAVLDAALVSVPLDTGRALTRYEVRVAANISQAPKGAYVVVAVDASRSTGSRFEPAAKAALDAYLSLLPDAQVEVLTFDRVVRRRLGRFGSASAARYAVQVMSLGQLNGSDVDRALFDADQLLSSAPPGAPRRLLLVTDGLARSTLTPERLRGALGQSHAVAHIGLLEGGGVGLLRVDDHPWAEAVRGTGGLVWQAWAPWEPAAVVRSAGALRDTYEEWVRPLRVDRINGFSDNFELVDELSLGSLREGEGWARWRVDASATHGISLGGELWSTPIRLAVAADPARTKLWSALVFGSPLVDELTEPEMLSLAMKGGAVSPVTSYLAIEPGVRPSTEGLTDVSTHLTRAPKVRMGGTRVADGRPPALDLQAYLEGQLRPAYARCGGEAGQAGLELETTKNEIVRVGLTGADMALEPLVATCVTEAAWALQLPEAFFEDWATFSVDL